MMFNFFKKKKPEAKTFEGRFISEEEIQEMIKPRKKSFISEELKDLNDRVEKLRHYGE